MYDMYRHDCMFIIDMYRINEPDYDSIFCVNSSNSLAPIISLLFYEYNIIVWEEAVLYVNMKRMS
jgi:hypothetical protein